MKLLIALCATLCGFAQLVYAGAPMRILPDYYEAHVYQGHMQEAPLKGCVTCRVVSYETTEAPGSIIIDTRNFYLYFVVGNGTAIRYGVGVGRVGFGWHGSAHVRRMSKWPTWTPTARMVREDPDSAYWAGGMPGGLGNPLGARALYLFEDRGDELYNARGVRMPVRGDTQYRIHGTWEPSTIGHNVSSGCIRMNNADVADLYARVTLGAKVVVR